MDCDNMILQLKDITLSFTNTPSEVFNLLNGVNLSVKQGEIMALVGGNGTGKTTLFNIISGFQENFGGDVIFNGKRLNGIPAYRISMMGIGRLFQGRQLMGDLTLMENMKIASDDKTGEVPFEPFLFPRKIARKEREKEEKAVSILKRLFGENNKYLGMLNNKASAFSYGEQRLIAITRLLMGNDRLLLLDEPTAGVTPVYIETIKEIIRKMVHDEGLTVLLIEHNMHFVRELADTCAYLDEGMIAKVGPAGVVLDNEEVRNSYLGL